MYCTVYCIVLYTVFYCILYCTLYCSVLYTLLYCILYCTLYCIVLYCTTGIQTNVYSSLWCVLSIVCCTLDKVNIPCIEYVELNYVCSVNFAVCYALYTTLITIHSIMFTYKVKLHDIDCLQTGGLNQVTIRKSFKSVHVIIRPVRRELFNRPGVGEICKYMYNCVSRRIFFKYSV